MVDYNRQYLISYDYDAYRVGIFYQELLVATSTRNYSNSERLRVT